MSSTIAAPEDDAGAPKKRTRRSFDGQKSIEPTLPEAPSSLAGHAFLRLRQIIGDHRSNPVLPPLIPVSKTTIWEWVKQGKFPKPFVLGEGTTAWRAKDVLEWMEGRKRTTDQSG